MWVSLGIGVASITVVLGVAFFLRARSVHARGLFDPLHILILLTQALDGSTTWIGVVNPFGYDIPSFEETVFVSKVVIENFGGFVYYLLKIMLGIGVVLTLDVAERGAHRARDRNMVLLVQLALVVIGAIPVFNNTANFLLAV